MKNKEVVRLPSCPSKEGRPQGFPYHGSGIALFASLGQSSWLAFSEPSLSRTRHTTFGRLLEGRLTNISI